MKKKDNMQGPQQSEIISLYCTTLGFIYKNKEIIPNKIYLTVVFEKLDIRKSC